MRTYIQSGHTLTLTAPDDLASGEGVLVGAIFGIAAHDALAGFPVETTTVGVFDIAKATGQAWAVGDRLFWDASEGQATTTATDNTLIGAAVLAAAAGDTVGRVRLNGTV